MPRLTFRPSGKTVKARPGQTLLAAAYSARVVILQRCGGHASCLSCRVVVEEGALSAPSALELRKMPETDLASGIRLACQARIVDRDCVVRVAESKWKSVVAAALKRQQEADADDGERT